VTVMETLVQWEGLLSLTLSNCTFPESAGSSMPPRSLLRVRRVSDCVSVACKNGYDCDTWARQRHSSRSSRDYAAWCWDSTANGTPHRVRRAVLSKVRDDFLLTDTHAAAHTTVRRSILESVAGLTQLEELHLSGCDELTIGDLARILQFEHLNKLSLSSSPCWPPGSIDKPNANLVPLPPPAQHDALGPKHASLFTHA
jgi:hypothetical protein